MSGGESVPGLEEALAAGLTEAEYGEIRKRLGRTPNVNELAMLSAMWSEH